jgi:four helix bundle protein
VVDEQRKDMEEKKQIKSFKDLEVWQTAYNVVLELYKCTKEFPKNEEFRITSQLLRAAVSIPTNIAEGMERYSKKELIQFLIISRGSTEECKYLILLSKDLDYLNIENYNILNEKLNSIGKMLNSFINSLRNANNQ